MNILIGGDFSRSFICDPYVRGDSRLIALLTKVGYVLSGSIEEGTNNVHSNLNSSHAMKIQSSILSENKNLHSTMKIFWVKKTLGNELLENNVFKTVINEVNFTENRYQVKLSYKESDKILGDSFKLRKQRLKSFTRTFEPDKGLLAEYDNVFHEQKTDNIIKKNQGPSYHNLGKMRYLPFKPVIRHDKTTTKLRIVFDASAKVDGLSSLNDG